MGRHPPGTWQAKIRILIRACSSHSEALRAQIPSALTCPWLPSPRGVDSSGHWQHQTINSRE